MSKAPAHYQTITNEYAVVTKVQHPMIALEGFSTVVPGEIIQFEDGALGQVVQFDATTITAQSFATTIPAVGSKVLRTGQEFSIPLAESMLGHMFDPLGMPLDGGYELDVQEVRPIDNTPPPLVQRTLIREQFITGLTVVDSLLPIGKGQRELVIGDQHTGKESVLFNSAYTGATAGSVVVYALIGKPKAEIERIKQFFAAHKILQNTVLVAASPDNAVSTIAATPFTAMTIAEYFRDLGRDVLIILDDLSKHAKFYRELALLERKFPGRDSYPGDIFYTHARLLERAGSFTAPENATEKKSVTITCLPVAETVNSDVTDYIISNLISITDGHLLYDPHLFAEGQRPAINTSLSVTRVGKQTQTALGRDLNRVLTSFMNTYHKTQNLTQFGSELSDESQATLQRGQLLLELFTQPNTTPVPLNVQQVLIGMVWLGWFSDTDDLTVKTVRENLIKATSTESTATKSTTNSLFAELTTAANFEAFLKSLESNKEALLELCNR